MVGVLDYDIGDEKGKSSGRTVAALGTLVVVTKHLVDGLSEELVHVSFGISGYLDVLAP